MEGSMGSEDRAAPRWMLQPSSRLLSIPMLAFGGISLVLGFFRLFVDSPAQVILGGAFLVEGVYFTACGVYALASTSK